MVFSLTACVPSLKGYVGIEAAAATCLGAEALYQRSLRKHEIRSVLSVNAYVLHPSVLQCHASYVASGAQAPPPTTLPLNRQDVASMSDTEASAATNKLLALGPAPENASHVPSIDPVGANAQLTSVLHRIHGHQEEADVAAAGRSTGRAQGRRSFLRQLLLASLARALDTLATRGGTPQRCVLVQRALLTVLGTDDGMAALRDASETARA